MRCFLILMAVALCVGCGRGRPHQGQREPDFRIVAVTDLQGYLEPCGCTSNPLGGIDRLAAQIRALRDGAAPVLLLLAGDTFYDVAELEPARVSQANRNATTLAGILKRLRATAVLPGERDRAQPKNALDELRPISELPWLAMSGGTEELALPVGEHRVALLGVAPGADRVVVKAAAARARLKNDLVVALVSGSRRDANRIGAIEGVDFVIQGGVDEDAPIPPRQAGRAWVLHAGRQGQGLVVIDVHQKKKNEPFVDRSEWSRAERGGQLQTRIDDLRAKIAAWEKSGDVDPADLELQRNRLRTLEAERRALDAPAAQPDGNAFFASWIELPKSLPRDPEIARLMREHDKALNDANRIAFAGLKPPPLGPGDVAYVGSQTCSTCHMDAFMWWRDHAHGVAYKTLQESNKEYNLDCVSCHVTGYEQPGGSTITHNLDGALVNVGCESCHGPGAAHSANPEVSVVRNTPESTCITCHNEEHSDLFDYEEYRKTLVVPGHGLPRAQR